jgi:nucleotidyltransferase substrate binding protein (TIGR01987 family)
MARLRDAAAKNSYTDLELAGLVQTFEFTFELAWKALKDVLNFEGFEANSPREVIQQAFRSRYIEDVDAWLLAMESRNILSHTYDEQNAQEAVTLIKGRFLPMLEAGFAFLQTKKANE